MEEEDLEFLDALFIDLLFELDRQEAQAWVDGVALFPDACPENSAEKTKGAANPSAAP